MGLAFLEYVVIAKVQLKAILRHVSPTTIGRAS